MLFCGVDIGTTNLKVALVDETSNVMWTRVVPTPRARDEVGVVTDPAELLTTVEDAIIAGCGKVGRGQSLEAIAATGVGEDGLCLDQDLRPIGPAIPWYDQRAAGEAEFIAGSRSATPRSGIRMDSARAGAKWLWLRRNQPAVVDAAKSWAALTDFPLIAWGGRPFMSETLASRTGCFDYRERRWIPELLAVCQAPPLPNVFRAGVAVGTVSQGRLLSKGAATKSTLLVAGGHDHPIAASAIQRIDPQARVDSLGTANVIYGESPAADPETYDPELCFVPPVRSGVGVGCLGVIEFSNAVKPLESELRTVLALDRIPGEPGQGEPGDSSLDRLLHVRGVLEFACLRARRMLDAMDGARVPSGAIYVTGGWSRSNSLLELRASVFGVPLLALSEREPAVVGAALLAAEAAGVAVKFKSAIARVDPLAEWSDAYADIYSHYQAALGRAPGTNRTEG